jgi:hypothetical protein
MKFTEKYKLVVREEIRTESLERELSEYVFDGFVEFSLTPVCLFDVDNNVVLNVPEMERSEDQSYFIEIDGVLNPVGKKVKFIQTETVKFNRKFGLQDFFYNEKDALGVIFYLFPENQGSVFHPGNQVRVAVIK